ncbi:putative uncharacterized protein DDB_G0282129 [Centruroides sculpturatus]|uniref:putative uncharacterized protein DDB_G0282129 n=1 Tax=Centruroides sculpturatus TaxID=218467 RepID=UPI000C6CBBEE|nr:putative uncharacterized protein DDB_G0282129 [Centruroides sculpturatus]XP_023235069.1 putative uncharacterized protein DDB_G0282129 [Centruroides sculpturatus]
MEPGNENSEGRRDDDNCCMCNPQICSSYVLGMFACILVIGGVFLSFHKWDYMWLIVSLVGIVLILLGALLHFCGTNASQKNAKRHRVNEQDLHEHLLPTAPPLSNAYSVSQLSLNMLPPYFSALDNVITTHTSPSAPPNSDNVSQIIQIKGQSFILLPISENVVPDSSENITVWNNPVLIGPKEQTNGIISKGPNIITVPIKEDCECQTDNPPEEIQVTVDIPSRTETEVQTASQPANKTLTTINIENESIPNNSLATEASGCQTENPEQTTSCTTDCDPLPTETNEEQGFQEREESNTSPEGTQSESLESEESVDLITTECNMDNTDSSLPEDEINLLIDDNANINTVSENIPTCLDPIMEPLPESINVINNDESNNNNPVENHTNQTTIVPENTINSDINENFPETSTLATDLVNNNEIEIGNMNIIINNNYTEYSSDIDITSNIFSDQGLCSTSHLTTNENCNGQFSGYNSDIDDAEICDRSSPPPSYEEVTQEQLAIAGYGIAYGTI